jgi:hypothetical protein
MSAAAGVEPVGQRAKVGGEARLRLSCGFGYAAGPAQEKGGAGLRGRGGKGRWASRMGQQAERARSRERGGRKDKFPSFFLFFFFFQSDFAIPFSKDFEFLFIFSQNHSSQK